jgi:hypothetical protein
MPLTPEQRAVKAATKQGQDDMRALDKASLSTLDELYRAAVEEIQGMLVAAAGAAGIVSAASVPTVLLLANARLAALNSERDAVLNHAIDKAAEIGVTPFRAAVNPAQLSAVQQEAAQGVREYVAPDKLKLSDRIWRLDRNAEEIVNRSVRGAVIRGEGASQAATDLLAKGMAPPADLALAKTASAATNIGKTVEAGLMTGRGAPRDNALRVMRTEINRAHTTAYQKGAAAAPGSVGTKFMLSPRHPRVDICDMHARANLHGLGPGVYPHGRSPLPAHPNTLSFEVIVYQDEVTEADKAGKTTVVDFLKTVPAKDRKGILGANKNEAFEAGKLSTGMVRSRWKDVRNRIGWQEDYRDSVSRRYFNQRATFPDGVPTLRIGGKTLTADQITRLTGAPDGAKIRFDPYADGPALRISHPFYQTDSKRSFFRTDSGDMALSNDLLLLNKETAPRGLGLRIFTTQAMQAQELGFKRIEIYAGRGGGMNGYHTWPQYGANATLPPDVRRILPPGLEGAKDLLDLMKTDAGRAFWRKEGYSIECSFDLTEGSRSWQQLIKQITAKKVSLKRWTGLT